MDGILDRKRVYLYRVGEGRDHMDFCGCPENYINQGRFRPLERRAEDNVEDIKSYYTLHRSGHWPCSRLSRSTDRVEREPYETQEIQEASRNYDYSVPWDGLDEIDEIPEASQN